MSAAINHTTYNVDNGNLTVDGEIWGVDRGRPQILNPPFNDPWKNRNSRRYRWKHGLLGGYK